MAVARIRKRSSPVGSFGYMVFILVLLIYGGSNWRGETYWVEVEQTQLSVPPLPAPITQKPRVYRYFEVYSQVMEMANQKSPQGLELPFSNTVYSRATVIYQAPWLPARRMCKETCCVQAVAISLDQDKEQLIHCRDGLDLADINLALLDRRNDHRKFQAANFHEALLPCLVPGTTIYTEDYSLFWARTRHQINVPYAVMTMGSDTNTPHGGDTYLADPLLLRWYGNNPMVLHSSVFEENKGKFQPMNLGLSGYNHPQERYMLPFQKINNFANPFLDKSRWDLSKEPLDFDKDVFVLFGNRDLSRRGDLFRSLCANSSVVNSTSCSRDKKQISIHQTYSDMSHYRFGVSPPGNGYDCYRTYEMLYLGVIPIIHERDAYSRELFADLPVIFVPNLIGTTTRSVIVDAIHKFIGSDTFQKSSFESGWERLFFHHRRRQVLKDTGRDKEILVDENGKEYYQAYHYTALGDLYGKYTACRADDMSEDAKEKCQDPGNSEERFKKLIANPPEMSRKDKQWLAEWEARGKILPQWEFNRFLMH